MNVITDTSNTNNKFSKINVNYTYVLFILQNKKSQFESPNSVNIIPADDVDKFDYISTTLEVIKNEMVCDTIH